MCQNVLKYELKGSGCSGAPDSVIKFDDGTTSSSTAQGVEFTGNSTLKFGVEMMTNGGKTACKNVLIIRCTPTPTVNINPPQLDYQILKGSPSQLLDLTTVMTVNPFYTECGGISYGLSSTDTSLTPTTDPNAAVSGTQMTISTATEKLSNLFLCAVATKSGNTRCIPITLLVATCSDAPVSPLQDFVFYKQINGPDSLVVPSTGIAGLFTASSKPGQCDISEWQLSEPGQSAPLVPSQPIYSKFKLAAKADPIDSLNVDQAVPTCSINSGNISYSASLWIFNGKGVLK